MNRKVVKIISILLMLSMAVIMFSTSVFAANSGTNWKDIDIGTFDNAQDKSDASTAATNITGSLISIIQVIGIGVAIIMLIVMAIKYVAAAPSEKAEIKKSATIYVVGAIVLFAASGILQIIKNFAAGNINDAVSLIEMTRMYLG